MAVVGEMERPEIAGRQQEGQAAEPGDGIVQPPRGEGGAWPRQVVLPPRVDRDWVRLGLVALLVVVLAALALYWLGRGGDWSSTKKT